MKKKHEGTGKSSFGSIDTERFFSLLDIQKGSTFVDLGCGRGDYALAASDVVGEEGSVYALDKWEEGIDRLRETAEQRGLFQVHALHADIHQRLPLDEGSADVCLLAGVLHHLKEKNVHEKALRDIRRILKEGGTLAVIEFKKFDGPPGPPIRLKIAPEELKTLVLPYGFREKVSVDIGSHHYFSIFC